MAFVILAFMVGSVRLEAQETAGQVIPPSEAKREASRGVPLGDRHMIVINSKQEISASPCQPSKNKLEDKDRQALNACPLRLQVLGQKILKNENGKDVTPPFPVSVPVAIVYPKKAVRKGWEGQAVVAAEILPDGSVGRMGLAKSSGYEDLDSAAQGAIKTWKFAAAPANDDAVPQYVDIPVTFKLKDHGE